MYSKDRGPSQDNDLFSSKKLKAEVDKILKFLIKNLFLYSISKQRKITI